MDKKRKNQILLSVALSCKGLIWVLKKNLSALQNQDLSKDLWEPVFILKEEKKDMLEEIERFFPSPQVCFLPQGQPLYEMRNLAFSSIRSPYMYFIDEDVILEDRGHLSRLLSAHKAHPEITVIGGGYLDHPLCGFYGRAYNFVARLWIKNRPGLAPGGNLSLKMEKKFKARFYSPGPLAFGGEEISFLQSLQAEGHRLIYKEELSAPHLALHSLRGFAQRAWIHGAGQMANQAEAKPDEQESEKKTLRGGKYDGSSGDKTGLFFVLQ